MPSLRETQEALRRSVIERDDRAALQHVVGEGLVARHRLAVYRNAFAGNLAHALRLSYPAVQRLVGADFFGGAAGSFARECPPHAARLDEYGADFPAFLAGFPPAASLAYLPDVARLEWAVNRALHAPDVQPLDAKQLVDIPPDDHDRLRFVVDPSIALLRTGYPVDAIWRAVLTNDDAALAAIDLAAGPVWLLVQRLAAGPEVTRLAQRAWQFSRAIFAGQPLGVALVGASGPEAAALLAEHITAGRFVAYSIATSVADTSIAETQP